MTSITSSPEHIEKVSSDNVVIGFDLLSNITYMACLATAQMSREVLLRRAGEQKLKTAVFFQQTYYLAQRLGLEYTRALQSVAERAKAQNIKSLLLRMASTISAGESELIFIREESELEARRYFNQYETSVDSLKKWTDAYAALLVSVTLIVVVALVSTLTGSLPQNFVVIMGFAMFFITGVGVWVIMRSAPYEEKAYTGSGGGPIDRRRARFLLLSLGSLGMIIAAILVVRFGAGAGLFAMGLFLLPAGFFANRDDSKVSQIDKEVATFLRTLGVTAGVKATTLGAALPDIDLKSMGSMEPHITRLQIRIASELPPDLCWEQFKNETGNELVRRSTGMLVEGVEAGGPAAEVADIAASYATQIAELRDVRRLTASSFNFLTLPMHAAMTGLLMFILAIIVSFNDRLREVSSEVISQAQSSTTSATVSPDLGMFQPQDLGMTTITVTGVVLVLTVANALAPKFAAGGHNLKLTWNFSLTCLISGFNLIVVPRVATTLFGG